MELVLQAQLAADRQRVRDVMARARDWPEEWREATVRRDAHVTLDADQLARLHEALDEVVDRFRPRRRVQGARRVSLVYMLLPTEHEAEPS